jgi:hypothetical protein
MFSLRDTLHNRTLPPGYNISMGIVVLLGPRPASITRLRNSPCPESVFVHFKSLLPITNQMNRFIDTQFIAMQRLFAEGGIAVLRGTTEDLSNNPTLQPLLNLNVGACLMGLPSADINTLFANRNNVGNNELVVYIVQTLIGGTGNFVGCATHPNNQPGVAVVQINARWLVAHEIGHVLRLFHNCEFPSQNNPNPPVPCIGGSGQSDNLMYPNVSWTNEPPNLSATEFSTMQNTGLTNPCN